MRSPIRMAIFGLVIGAIAIPLLIAGEENTKPSDAVSADNIAGRSSAQPIAASWMGLENLLFFMVISPLVVGRTIPVMIAVGHHMHPGVHAEGGVGTSGGAHRGAAVDNRVCG